MSNETKQAQSKDGATKAAEPTSVLALIFECPDSTLFSLQVKAVSPAQMLVAAKWLEWYALRQFEAQARHDDLIAHSKQIAIPGIQIPKG